MLNLELYQIDVISAYFIEDLEGEKKEIYI
jgi:hypothetical protein